MIQLKQPYNKFLESRAPQSIPLYSGSTVTKDGKVRFKTLEKPKTVIIPPLNSNINFSSVDPETIRSFKARLKEVPETFSLTDENKNLTPVQNQFNCGCCWAFACAASINDNLIYQEIVEDNPNISPSYLMSCDATNNKCQGGNPSTALQWIQENGISTDEFENFSWCSSNASCTSPNFTGSLSELNSLVPSCKTPPTELKFFIKNISRPVSLSTSAEITTNITMVKRKLMENGSLLGGIIVYENLLSGNFLHPVKNPDAIYLDKVDYVKMQYQKDDFQIVGFHAITVTGWGEGNVDSSLLGQEGNEKVRVPYWLVRNSWSADWGMDGYFRLAMYPFNKLCQLEKPIEVKDSEEYVGGFLFFDVDGFGYKEKYTEPSCEVSAGDFNLILVNSIFLAIFCLLFLCSFLYILSPIFS